MTTFDLAPGSVTTREAVAQVYGGSVYSGGIVPAEASKKVFVYSDPSVGEKHGYTFDGQAEDDEFGTLYLYTGAGPGNQKMARGNKTLMDTLTNGREIHLFVADGTEPGKKLVKQRYIGQVVLDELPYVMRKAPDKHGVNRQVYVFRFRPAPGAVLALEPQDAVKPATKNGVVDLPLEWFGEAVQGVKAKGTEKHTTSETIANIKGGPRKVERREGQLVSAFEEYLTAVGHAFKSFQIAVEGERGPLVPDLYDVTANVLYEAKGLSTRPNIRMAVGQLLDYRRHLKGEVPEGMRLAVLLPSQPTPDARAFLDAEGIAVVVQEAGGFVGFPVQ
ncbi:hypothetical protein ABTX80_07820 [Streptomyces erythrochromogenes]|uniref:hypothetical protein n=1 Tax=Streptomyces erythrochromogenes TaxID=285574 RepID=UPI00331CE6D1